MSANVLMDKVADHYDQNPGFASVLNQYLPGFEYPDWSHRTVGDVITRIELTQLAPWVGIEAVADSLGVEVPLEYRHYSERVIHNLCETHGWAVFDANRVAQKEFEGELLFALFDDRSRYLALDRNPEFKDVVFDVDCRGVDVGVMAAIVNQKAEAMHLVGKLEALIGASQVVADVEIAKAAYSRIEARDMAYGDAELTLKLAEIIGAPEIEPRSRTMHDVVVEVLSPVVAGLWAEVDIVDYHKISIHQDMADAGRLLDAALCIASNMGRNVAYKAAVVEFSPEVANEVMKVYSAEKEKVLAKEARKSAEYAEMASTRWSVFKNDDSGMVGLEDHWSIPVSIIELGGVPAIQNFAKENPDVPVRVINELLARDGGYTFPDFPVELASLYPFPCLEHTSEPGQIVRGTIDEYWAVGAGKAVLAHSLRSAEMIADTKGSYAIAGSDQSYDGKVMDLTAQHVVLSLGRSAVICEQAALDRVPSKDEMVSIAFTAGRGVVSPPVQEKEVDNGR